MEKPTFDFDISDIPISTYEPHPLSYYKHNRERLQENMKKHMGDNFKEGSIAIFKGHHTHMNNHDDDATADYQPEWNFYYLFGFEGQEDPHAVFNFSTGEVVIALHQRDEVHKVFCGDMGIDEDPAKYGVDKFIWMHDLRAYVESLNPPEIFILKGKIRDEMSHYARFDWLDSHPKLNAKDLYQVLCLQRSIKSEYEIKMMKRITEISCEAHKYVMKKARPGMTEFKCRELFKLYCGMNGAPHEAYGSICGCASNAAILHYIVDDRQTKQGDLILNDMGARGNGYVADVTCTFPLTGKFTEKQKNIYNTVWRAVKDCEAMMKPGVSMSTIHKKSCRTILEGLIEHGLITCDIETAVKHNLNRTFYPHGLGHYMGLYVHDVGQCKFPKDSDIPHSQGIFAVDLQPGMCTSNEPGIYFIQALIDKAKNDEKTKDFYNFDKIAEYYEVGGVRIEENVLITEDGCETYSHVPRTVEEIEAWMAQE